MSPELVVYTVYIRKIITMIGNTKQKSQQQKNVNHSDKLILDLPIKY